jgi:hypothetical protein
MLEGKGQSPRGEAPIGSDKVHGLRLKAAGHGFESGRSFFLTR